MTEFSGGFGTVFFSEEEPNIAKKLGEISENEVSLLEEASLFELAPCVFGFNLGDIKGEYCEDRKIQFYEDSTLFMENLRNQGYKNLTHFHPTGLIEELFQAIRKLHLLGISHNDLHDRNIMVEGKTKKIKFVDFGHASDSYASVILEAFGLFFEQDIPTYVEYSGLEFQRLFPFNFFPSEALGKIQDNLMLVDKILCSSGVKVLDAFSDKERAMKPLVELIYQGVVI